MNEATRMQGGSERTLRRCLALIIVGCCAVLALTVAPHLSGFHVWDDAYMYVRYVDNLFATGRLSWNVGAAPTYGLTAPLCLGLFVPIRLLVPGNFALAAVAQSLVAGVAFLVLAGVLLVRQVSAEPLARRFLLALVFFWLALAAPHLNLHFVSGMDTMFALAYLTVYIAAAKWQERAPSWGRAVLLGVVGGVAFIARPDLLLYAALVPLSMLVFARDARARVQALASGGVSLLVLGLEMGLARLYFGSALPLPFFAKSIGLYGAEVHPLLRPIPFRELATYVVTYWFPLALAGAYAVVHLRGRWRDVPPVDRGLLVATPLFIAYYLFGVVQVMGWSSRFYYPTLPAVLYLAAAGAASLVRAAAPGAGDAVRRIPGRLCWLGALLALYALMPQARAAAQALREARKEGRLGRFSVRADYEANFRAYWFRLPELSALPDDLVIATTEVGRVAALNPHKAIIDLTGLNETEFAHHHFSAERLFRKYQPDLIYMPHYFYKHMTRSLVADPSFGEHYELFRGEDLAAASGLRVVMSIAIRRDSRHYEAMRAILLAPATAQDGAGAPPHRERD